MNEENSGHSKFQANAAHLWTPVPLHLNLRRWSGKKLVVKFGWHIAQRRILDPKFSCAGACSGSRDCPFTKGSDSHYTDILSFLQPAGLRKGVSVAKLLFPTSVPTPCMCFKTIPGLEGGKGFHCLICKGTKWISDTGGRVVWITSEGSLYFLAIEMGKSTYSNSVNLEAPEGGQYHTAWETASFSEFCAKRHISMNKGMWLSLTY